MTWMLTHSARKMDLAAPAGYAVHTSDISHALGNLCRFGGHTRRFYSVAQHSVLVATLLPDELKLAGLLHDAAEAYLGDVIQPLKLLLKEFPQRTRDTVELVASSMSSKVARDNLTSTLQQLTLCASSDPGAIAFQHFESIYHQAEAAMHAVICERFGIDPEFGAAEIRHADLVALATEKRDLLPADATPWECLEGIEPHPGTITPWTPEEAAMHYHSHLMEQLQLAHRRRCA